MSKRKPRGGDSDIQTACHAKEKITFSSLPTILPTILFMVDMNCTGWWVKLANKIDYYFFMIHDSWFSCKSSSYFFLTWFRWWRLSFPSSHCFNRIPPLVPFIFQWMMRELGSLKNHYSFLFAGWWMLREQHDFFIMFCSINNLSLTSSSTPVAKGYPEEETYKETWRMRDEHNSPKSHWGISLVVQSIREFSN